MVTMFGWFKTARACGPCVKQLGEFGVAHAFGREKFERDETVLGFLLRFVDHAHAAASETFEDLC